MCSDIFVTCDLSLSLSLSLCVCVCVIVRFAKRDVCAYVCEQVPIEFWRPADLGEALDRGKYTPLLRTFLALHSPHLRVYSVHMGGSA